MLNEHLMNTNQHKVREDLKIVFVNNILCVIGTPCVVSQTVSHAFCKGKKREMHCKQRDMKSHRTCVCKEQLCGDDEENKRDHRRHRRLKVTHNYDVTKWRANETIWNLARIIYTDCVDEIVSGGWAGGVIQRWVDPGGLDLTSTTGCKNWDNDCMF